MTTCRLGRPSKKAQKKIYRPHSLPWSSWLDRLPSLSGLNRRDVRIIAADAIGNFPFACGHTSYVSSSEVFRLRQNLRKQAQLKRLLLQLRRELITKTHGWLLRDDGSISTLNEPSVSIQHEIDRIKKTLSTQSKLNIQIDAAVRNLQNKLRETISIEA